MIRLEERELLSAVPSTTDSNQPTDAEQLFLAEVNKARANPAAAGQRLYQLAQTDPVLKVATSGWDMNTFLATISAIPPEPPLAFNTSLIEAARAHSAAMLAENLQFHSAQGYLTNSSVATASNGQAYYPTGPGGWATGENIFAYSGNVNSSNVADYVNYFAAAFLIDWGNPDYGHLYNELAPGPGEANLSSGHYPYNEIGIGLLTNVTPTTSPGTIPGTSTNAGLNVGPAIVTEEFGWRSGNPILTGIFYNDKDNNQQYAIGEGMGGVKITAVGLNGQGTFSTTTWNSGGYSLPLPAGRYTVTASGGGLVSAANTTVTLGQDNVEWDNAVKTPQFTVPADQPVPGDYSGTGVASLAVYRPSTGQWFFEGKAVGVNFGGGGGVDIPLSGNYLPGSATELALYRTTTSQWFVLGQDGVGKQLGVLGAPGYDVPEPGNYLGTGLSEPAVYRPSTGEWFVMQPNGAGKLYSTIGGASSDIPVPGDYDGVGRTEAAVYRASTGEWFVDGPDGGHQIAQLGQPGLDIPVPGNYDGTGKIEPAVYRPTTGEWFILGPGGVVRSFVFGGANLDVPLKADFDGKGFDDPVLYRPTTGQWFIYHTSTGQKETRQLGQGGNSVPISTWLENYSVAPSPQISHSLIFPQAVDAGPGLLNAASRSLQVGVPYATTSTHPVDPGVPITPPHHGLRHTMRSHARS